MVRLPKNLSTNFTFKSGVIKTGESTLEYELLAEKAHSLSLAADTLSKALTALNDVPANSQERNSALRIAAQATHAYFIQRELMGMFDHKHPIKHYNIPSEVLVRVGAK